VKTLYLFSILLVLAACSMSTEQEMELNHSLNNMIQARNDGDGLSYLNFTHPSIVKYYKSKGDSALIKKFQEVEKGNSRSYEDDQEMVYWGTGYVKEVKSKDSILQARIEIKLYQDHVDIDSTAVFYATSYSGETDWLFAQDLDYFSKAFPVNQRLFSK
tara:strand:+ start:44109 stop:44585 length:477 start_codon:yes stop_codon:yes gene_type:complete